MVSCFVSYRMKKQCHEVESCGAVPISTIEKEPKPRIFLDRHSKTDNKKKYRKEIPRNLS